MQILLLKVYRKFSEDVRYRGENECGFKDFGIGVLSRVNWKARK